MLILLCENSNALLGNSPYKTAFNQNTNSNNNKSTFDSIPDHSVKKPLYISENKHYLMTREGKPFFWLADTQWALNKLSDEQIIKILDDRLAKGFNVVQVFGVRSWGKDDWVGDQSWAQTDANGNLPFINWNPIEFNEIYWERWNWICDELGKRNMKLLILIGDPLRKDAIGKVKSLDECYNYGRLVGDQFKEKRNVIFSISQDNPPYLSIFGIPGFNAAAEGLADGLNGENNYNDSADYTTCLFTYHTHSCSSEWFQNSDWLDFNGVQGSRNEVEGQNNRIVYERVRSDYLRKPTKPVMFLEGSYETEPNKQGQLKPTTPKNVRMQFCYAVFAGSPGYSYGHWDNWRQYKSLVYLDSPASVQVSLLASFFRKQEWWKFEPANDIITKGNQEGERMSVALKSDDAVLVYIPFAGKIYVKNVLNKKASAWWFDPRNGKKQQMGALKAFQEKEVYPPKGWEDAILIIK